MASFLGVSSSISRLELFTEWHKHKQLKRDELCEKLKLFVATKIDADDSIVQDKVLKFIKNAEIRWKKCSRNVTAFKRKHISWLNSLFVLQRADDNICKPSTSKFGRPIKEFEKCSLRGKQVKAKKLSSEKSLEELSFATQMELRKSGKRTAASVLGDITSTSPKRAHKYKRAYRSLENSSNKPVVYSEDEALSLIINAKLSKQQYLLIRSEAKIHNVHIYPSWHKIMEAKTKCYPEPNSVEIDEKSANIRLQNIIDITTKRICQLQDEIIKTLPEQNKYTMICKWGCDGSSGQSNFKQSFSEEGQDDSSVFITSFVPLQLYCESLIDPKNREIVWRNPSPSSTQFCRPIKFMFSPETSHIIKQETDDVQQQIDILNPTIVSGNIAVDYTFILTMVDGKVCNSLTDTTSTQVCYICKAKPSEMNDVKRMSKKIPIKPNYSFGLSPLHSWIRFFECCLHISYRLEVKTWQVRGKSKMLVNNRKKQIVDNFRKELGLIVDQPKPGYGSTKYSSKITGIDQTLTQRFGVILKAISCGCTIDPENFDNYAKETAKLFIEKYPWFNMPTSVHKVLFHGAEVIKHAILPIGQLSEEAQEAKNKDFKYVREHHTRKNSRVATNEDLLNYLILSSDPTILHLAHKNMKRNKQHIVSPDIVFLLKDPEVYGGNSESDLSE